MVKDVVLAHEFPVRVRALPFLRERPLDVAIEVLASTVVRIKVFGVVVRELPRLAGRFVDQNRGSHSHRSQSGNAGRKFAIRIPYFCDWENSDAGPSSTAS